MIYKIPVIWQMYGVIEVKADTLSQAITIADEKHLPEGHYIEDSFIIDHDGIPILNPEGQRDNINLTSIISFPKRGLYGNPLYPGNCSGYVIKALLEHYSPIKLFVDPAEGSGTSGDTAHELGIRYVGLDLHSEFNLLKESILERVGKPNRGTLQVLENTT